MTDLSCDVWNLDLIQNAFVDIRLSMFSVLKNADKTVNLTLIFRYLQALSKTNISFYAIWTVKNT